MPPYYRGCHAEDPSEIADWLELLRPVVDALLIVHGVWFLLASAALATQTAWAGGVWLSRTTLG